MEFSGNFDAFPEVENELTLGGTVGVPSDRGPKVHVGEGAGVAAHVVLVPPVSLVQRKRSLSLLRIQTNVGSVSQPGNCTAWPSLHHHVVQRTLNIVLTQNTFHLTSNISPGYKRRKCPPCDDCHHQSGKCLCRSQFEAEDGLSERRNVIMR